MARASKNTVAAPDPPEEDDFDPSAEDISTLFAPPPAQAAPWGNPNPTKPDPRLDITAPLAACEIVGATQWLVERMNTVTGRDDQLGVIHLKASTPEFIGRFIDAMPQPGQTPVTFFLWPLDAAGNRLTPAGKPFSSVTIPPEHVSLKALRAQQDATGGVHSPYGSNPVILLLQQQLASMQEQIRDAKREADAARERADAAREAALQERASNAASMTGELSTVFQQASKIQSEAATSALEAQREAARTQRELEAEDRRARREEERAAREEERRARADEFALKIKAMEIEAELKREALKLEAEQLRIRAQEERDRLERERREAEDRRREERDAERDRRDREDAARREHELKLENLRLAAEEREAERDRQHRESQQQLFNATLALAAKREEREQGHKLGVIGELLDLTGMTPASLLEEGKKLIAGGAEGGGIGVAIVQGITDLGKEIVKRLPEIDEDDEDDEDGEAPEDGEEPEEEPEPEPRARKKKPQGIPTALRGLQSEQRALPAPQDPVPEAPKPEPTPIPIEQTKAGREAFEALAGRLSGQLPMTWGPIVAQAATELPALVPYLSRVGIAAACAEMDFDAAVAQNLAAAFDSTNIQLR